MSTIQTILHPTDFSENAHYAFQMASNLARDYHARLVLLHVMHPFVSPIMHEPLANPLEAAEAQTHWKRRFAWPEVSDATIQVEHRVAEGDAPEEILRLAKALQCDLIVMGTHGRSGLGRLVSGSVAEEVLRNAPCPVLAVRTPPREGSVADVNRPAHAIESVVRLIAPAGPDVSDSKCKGEIILQCLAGELALSAHGKTENLEVGKIVRLGAGEAHTATAIKNASVLVTVLLPEKQDHLAGAS
jgi:nucleotide-binding universal stress UspA family protein/quercetin dioxygenase-like cupin family protein